MFTCIHSDIHPQIYQHVIHNHVYSIHMHICIQLYMCACMYYTIKYVAMCTCVYLCLCVRIYSYCIILYSYLCAYVVYIDVIRKYFNINIITCMDIYNNYNYVIMIFTIPYILSLFELIACTQKCNL